MLQTASQLLRAQESSRSGLPLPEQYLAHLKELGRSKHTLLTYSDALYRLSVFLNQSDSGLSSGSDAPEKVLSKFPQFLRDRYKTATVQQTISVARNFYRWLHEKGYVETAPDLSSFSCTSLPPRTSGLLGHENIREKIESALSHGPFSTREVRQRVLAHFIIDSTRPFYFFSDFTMKEARTTLATFRLARTDEILSEISHQLLQLLVRVRSRAGATDQDMLFGEGHATSGHKCGPRSMRRNILIPFAEQIGVKSNDLPHALYLRSIESRIIKNQGLDQELIQRYGLPRMTSMKIARFLGFPVRQAKNKICSPLAGLREDS